MRTLKTVWMLTLVVLVAGACAGKGRVNTTPTPPGQTPAVSATTEKPTTTFAGETLEQRLARQRKEELIRQMSETPYESLVRNRAEQIKREKELAQAERTLRKKDTPEMKKARKQLSDEARHDAKVMKARAASLQNANIVGCSGGVTVESRATGFWASTSYVKVRVINNHTGPVSIEDEAGPVATGFCTGGSLSLFRARNYFADGGYVSFRYVAQGVLPDGTPGVAYSQMYTLTSYDISSGRGQQFYTWEIKLQPR